LARGTKHHFYILLLGMRLKDVDDSEAFSYFKKASERNNRLGEIELAKCYEEGRGVGIDLDTAAGLFIQRPENSDLDGMMGLSRCFMKGIHATPEERRQLAVQISAEALDIIKNNKKYKYGKVIFSLNPKRKVLVICGNKLIQYYADGTKSTEMEQVDDYSLSPWAEKDFQSVIICLGYHPS